MDQEQDHNLSDSTADIRAAIATTRDQLGQHLSALIHQYFPSQGADGLGETTMPTAKSTKSTSHTAKASVGSTKAGKSAVKRLSPGKTEAKGTKKSTPGKKNRGVEDRFVTEIRHQPQGQERHGRRAGQMLDTMIGRRGRGSGQGRSAIGFSGRGHRTALKGSGKKAGKAKSTSAVLEEMAPGVAVGAIVGAAQTVMPNENGKAKKKSKA